MKGKFSRKHLFPRPFSLFAGPAHLEQVGYYLLCSGIPNAQVSSNVNMANDYGTKDPVPPRFFVFTHCLSLWLESGTCSCGVCKPS